MGILEAAGAVVSLRVTWLLQIDLSAQALLELFILAVGKKIGDALHELRGRQPEAEEGGEDRPPDQQRGRPMAQRLGLRLITEVSGINFLCPKLFLAILLNTLIFLGFPGSIFFVSEFLFFAFFFDLFPLLALFLLLFLYLIGPTFFFRS